jgi:hypothetical protein
MGIDPLVGIHWATHDYFSTLGIRLIRGRNFTDRDHQRPQAAGLPASLFLRARTTSDNSISRL